MSRKRHTAEQIIRKLREAEVELTKAQTTVEVVRKLGITEQTYYRWRKEYGGLRLYQTDCSRSWSATPGLDGLRMSTVSESVSHHMRQMETKT